MSTNNFSGLVSTAFLNTHKDMIDALVDDCGQTCRLIYNSTRFTDCPNCKFNPSTGRSANIYQAGGPIPFSQGRCPYCNGAGRTRTTSTDDVTLISIWDSKSWINLSQNLVNTADISVQTMGKIADYSKLKRANGIVIDTSIENLGVPEFVRVGDPEPCGFGATHIITSWRRA